ncbi:WD40-like Beta Propeller Repeat [Saccharicrinis carchari]|uniref:WD40-like Beta Propeller Repeat n=1 Tax=Saccharicrinis carchari TaxID=1168039 RepID=A0A521B3S4_SACCC|nr:PD40 domain-containing protein [Saccharicrinis carchari]SMO41709.1 WD40-like Beta Propeller Repeat [Saccharicrinis carchari]
MKKNYLLLLTLSFIVSAAFGQPRIVDEPVKILFSDEVSYMNAVWSPDGQMIAFSGDKHNGIWVVDADGKNLTKLTSDPGAGFGFSWSLDSKFILARSVFSQGFRKYHNVKLYDVRVGTEHLILEKSRNLKGLPVFSNGDGLVAMMLGKNMEKKSSGIPALKNTGTPQKEAILFSGALMPVLASSKVPVEVKFPEFKGRYVFNSAISPAGNKVVFQVSGLGLYVADVSGQNLKKLGKGEQASWTPDGIYIVVTMVDDDGSRITSGKLYTVNVQTGEYMPLLDKEDMVAMNPDISSDGKYLLFENSLDGAIYKARLK